MADQSRVGGVIWGPARLDRQRTTTIGLGRDRGARRTPRRAERAAPAAVILCTSGCRYRWVVVSEPCPAILRRTCTWTPTSANQVSPVAAHDLPDRPDRGRARRRPSAAPLAVLGQTPARPGLRRTGQESPAPPPRHPPRDRRGVEQRADRVHQHQDAPDHPTRVRLPQCRRRHRARHALPRRQPPRPAPPSTRLITPTGPAEERCFTGVVFPVCRRPGGSWCVSCGFPPRRRVPRPGRRPLSFWSVRTARRRGV